MLTREVYTAKQQKQRLNIVIDQRTQRDLIRAREALDASNFTATIRQSLRLIARLDELGAIDVNGGILLRIRKKDGSFEQVLFV